MLVDGGGGWVGDDGEQLMLEKVEGEDILSESGVTAMADTPETGGAEIRNEAVG